MAFSATSLYSSRRAGEASASITWKEVNDHFCSSSSSVWLSNLTTTIPLNTLFDDSKLKHDDCKRMFNEPNAGGNSIVSEVLSLEFMIDQFNANLVKTEMEIEYHPRGGSITDYLVRINNNLIAVSVCRAITKPGTAYTLTMARDLLIKKLKGIMQSNLTNREGWTKQILHIWAENPGSAVQIFSTFQTIPASLRGNTIVIVTVCESLPHIFQNAISPIVKVVECKKTKSKNWWLVQFYKIRRRSKRHLKKFKKNYYEPLKEELPFLFFILFLLFIYYLVKLVEFIRKTLNIIL
ncbi:hypothetical protein Ciccas_011025 [Cichlidogyrus casuarinus]|uniref:Uncharacterized protein n=1 Tax=Cichlidogyrus casuarinus TaxID=1844966 RepID=A0ABD2PSF4_9PLAT